MDGGPPPSWQASSVANLFVKNNLKMLIYIYINSAFSIVFASTQSSGGTQHQRYEDSRAIFHTKKGLKQVW